MVSALIFRRWIARLRKDCPIIGYKMRVIRTKDLRAQHETLYGYITKKRRTYTIQIAHDMDEMTTRETLLHEWAHAKSGDMSHGPKWGRAYAEVYRAFHDCA